MNCNVKTAICLVLALCFTSGCSILAGRSLVGPGKPEEVYIAPNYNHYRNSKVGVFSFTEPSYAPGTGRAAAQMLCRQLEKNRVFAKTTLEYTTIPDKMMEVAKQEKYDLIITGDVLYWFDGSAMEASRVEQEIKVIKPLGKKATTLWRARAAETAWPKPLKDYLLFQKGLSPAPTTMALLMKNSGKFCNMMKSAW